MLCAGVPLVFPYKEGSLWEERDCGFLSRGTVTLGGKSPMSLTRTPVSVKRCTKPETEGLWMSLSAPSRRGTLLLRVKTTSISLSWHVWRGSMSWGTPTRSSIRRFRESTTSWSIFGWCVLSRFAMSATSSILELVVFFLWVFNTIK